jgi:hypothetical protein
MKSGGRKRFDTDQAAAFSTFEDQPIALLCSDDWIDQLFDKDPSLPRQPAMKLAHSALASAKLAAALSDEMSMKSG